MAADGKQLDLWKTVVSVGVAMSAAGVSLLLASRNSPGNVETYGLILLVGGLALVVLGLVYAFWLQSEWRRPPRLVRGLRCSHYPTGHDPSKFPNHPYWQDLAIGVHRQIYPPDFRVICNAPILKIEGTLVPIANPPQLIRPITRSHTAIEAVSVHFSPLEPIKPPATLHLLVFSNAPIRVRRIKRLKTKYPPT